MSPEPAIQRREKPGKGRLPSGRTLIMNAGANDAAAFQRVGTAMRLQTCGVKSLRPRIDALQLDICYGLLAMQIFVCHLLFRF
jgi:hypothetical protein